MHEKRKYKGFKKIYSSIKKDIFLTIELKFSKKKKKKKKKLKVII